MSRRYFGTDGVRGRVGEPRLAQLEIGAAELVPGEGVEVARHLGARQIAAAVWLSVRRLRHAPRGVHTRALVAGLATWPGELLRRMRR